MYNTPTTQISLDGRAFYVKRDDLADPFLAGNKFRKLHALLETPPQKLQKPSNIEKKTPVNRKPSLNA